MIQKMACGREEGQETVFKGSRSGKRIPGNEKQDSKWKEEKKMPKTDYPLCGRREEMRDPKDILQDLPRLHRANTCCVGSWGKTRSLTDISFGVGTAHPRTRNLMNENQLHSSNASRYDTSYISDCSQI